MIDMRQIFSHQDYTSTVSIFKTKFAQDQLNCDEYWTSFMGVHKDISNSKCPICEEELSEYPNKHNSPTIDHFRPKADNMYPKLRCEPENYLLMCSLCNSTYKEDKFPLLDEDKRATEANVLADTNDEMPLLINPAYQNPLDYFELAFRRTHQGGILELKRNSNKIPKNKDSYEYKICETTIKLFGLGYCNTYEHPNENTKNCRIDILTKHYKSFIKLAEIMQNKDRKGLALFMKDSKNKFEELEKYGFFKFIIKEQFTIN